MRIQFWIILQDNVLTYTTEISSHVLVWLHKHLQDDLNWKILEAKESHPPVLKTEAIQSMFSVQYNAVHEMYWDEKYTICNKR